MQPILTAEWLRHNSGLFKFWLLCAASSDAVKTADLIVIRKKKKY